MQQPEKQHWRFGKEVPVATIVVLLLQTAGVLWWAAMLAAKVDYMEKSALINYNLQVQTDRRQDEESRRMEERVLVQLDKLNLKLDRVLEKQRGDRN